MTDYSVLIPYLALIVGVFALGGWLAYINLHHHS